MLDQDGYPTDETLKTIENWPYTDHLGLMKYIKEIWHHGDWGWDEIGLDEDDKLMYSISTGGWSGNESIISALQDNFMFWSMCWYSSKRGGHYEFRVKE